MSKSTLRHITYNVKTPGSNVDSINLQKGKKKKNRSHTEDQESQSSAFSTATLEAG